MSRSVRTLAVTLLLAAAAAVGVPATASAAAAPACAVAWGSLARTSAPLGTAPAVAVRTGRHACFDRVVVEVAGPLGGYDVRYVPQVVQDGSGLPVPVPGGARLQLVVHHPAYDANGNATPAVRDVAVPGYRTLRSVVFAGTFEGYTTYGVGTRARLPFRVTVLPGPGGHTRLVLDVAHRW